MQGRAKFSGEAGCSDDELHSGRAEQEALDVQQPGHVGGQQADPARLAEAVDRDEDETSADRRGEG